MVSDQAPVAFEAFLPAILPIDKKPKKDKPDAKQGPSVDPAVLKENPWLEGYLKGPGGSSASLSAKEEDATEDEEEFDPESQGRLDSAFRELARLRLAWQSEHEVTTIDFVPVIRGGNWTQEHKNTVTDCIAGQAASPLVEAWCRKYGLNMSSSYSFNKYGHIAASVLATAWCHRMQHFWDIYKRQRLANYQFTQADVDSYQEELSFVEFQIALPVESPAYPRVDQLKILRPVNPAARPKRASKASSSSGPPASKASSSSGPAA